MTRQEVAKNFINSMEMERVRRGYTQPQMAEKLGVSASGYKKIIAGDTNKIDLYTAYQVSKLSGKFIFELCGEKSAELETFKDYRRLTSSQRAFVNDIIHFEQDFQDNNTDAEESISVIVPSGDVKDGMIWDSANVIKVNAAPYLKKFGRELHCGVMVNSDHLQPVYEMGDILLISKRPPRSGDVAIFINKEEGRAYLRKFRQTGIIRLDPINEYGVTIELNSSDFSDDGKWLKMGCVLTKMRS